MKIVCVMPVYNCADVVLEALKSIDGKVDEIMCFDGRYVGYEGSDHSIDGTDKIITEFAKTSKSKVSYIQLPVLYEWESNNEMLKRIDIGDWVIKIDSDELILEWVDVEKTLETSTEKAYRLYWMLYKSYSAMPNARFYRKTETLHFETNHREIFDKDGFIDVPHAPKIHIVINHQELASKKKTRHDMNEYEKRLHQYEQEI